MSGPPVISGQLLYAGTGGAGAPSNGHFFALDVKTGKMVWRFPMGRYIGAMVQHETIYVSSGDRSIHALDGQSGRLRWRKPFAPGQYAAVMAHGVLYLTADGVYAHRSEDGTVLWHQSLESSRSVTFGQPVILDGAVYLVRFDNRGRGTIYALDARTGAECWRIPFPTRGAQLAVAQ